MTLSEFGDCRRVPTVIANFNDRLKKYPCGSREQRGFFLWKPRLLNLQRFQIANELHGLQCIAEEPVNIFQEKIFSRRHLPRIERQLCIVAPIETEHCLERSPQAFGIRSTTLRGVTTIQADSSAVKQTDSRIADNIFPAMNAPTETQLHAASLHELARTD